MEAKKAPYPSRFNGYQAIWLTATIVLLALGLMAGLWLQALYLTHALIGFFLARMGLENPKPKEEKKP